MAFTDLEMHPDLEGCYRLASVSPGTDASKRNNICFFPWREAITMTGDGIALAAIAQLLATLNLDMRKK